MAFYMKDLSIQGFWNLLGVVLGPFPVDTEDQFYSLILFCDTVLLLPRLTSESTSLANLT